MSEDSPEYKEIALGAHCPYRIIRRNQWSRKTVMDIVVHAAMPGISSLWLGGNEVH